MAERSYEENDPYRLAYQKVLVPMCKGKVLDIGCGHGYLSVAIARQPEVNIVVATDKLPVPERLYTPRVFHEELRTEDLLETRVAPFDTIISTEHIEHLDEEFHRPLLAWIRRSLKPDGVFLGTMPDIENSGSPFHKKEYRKEQWARVIESVFADVQYPLIQNAACYAWAAKGSYGDRS